MTITKEQLTELYLEKGLSCLKIGRDLGISIATVSRHLTKYDIPTRPFSSKGIKTRLGMKNKPETNEKLRQWHLGKKIPAEIRRKMGSKGSKNPGWIDGRTPENKRIRNSVEYRLWREAVFARDNFTCVHCHKRGGELHADHIKPFAWFPELRLAIDNGRTLCVPCHRKTPTFGWKLLAKPKNYYGYTK